MKPAKFEMSSGWIPSTEEEFVHFRVHKNSAIYHVRMSNGDEHYIGLTTDWEKRLFEYIDWLYSNDHSGVHMAEFRKLAGYDKAVVLVDLR